MIELRDQDILLRLTSSEDSTVERKTSSDYGDCLKTAVAFSNSLPVDDPGIIFIGVYDDGRVQDGNNTESLLNKVSERIRRIYPPIFPQFKVMEKDGKEFLALIIRGSPERPHFSGPAYVRVGSQSIDASEEQFNGLIAERNSMVREILKWREQEISFNHYNWNNFAGLPRRIIVECNQFFLTLGDPEVGSVETFPLSKIDIAFDHEMNRLEIRINP